MEILEENKKKIFKAVFVLLIILSIFFIVLIFSEFKKDSMLGESATPATISFSGHGEINATPDIANISFTILKDATTSKEAMADVALVEKKALDFLKTKNIADKDIKTDNASFYPKYEYQNVCPSTPEFIAQPWRCPANKQVLVGYEASENITVKVRNVDDAGAVMQGLGDIGISNLSGPNFAIDKEDSLKSQARKLAIDDAKAKASALAKDLGVSLVKITDFSDSGNNFPIMYSTKGMATADSVSAPAPAQLPTGESTISSDVTITYEIR